MSINRFMDAIDRPIVKNNQKKLGYVFEPSKVTLSYSRRQTLFSCPRKFLIKEFGHAGSYGSSIHTAYGSAFGAAVQELFRSASLERAFMAALGEWDLDGFNADSTRLQNKDFWSCLCSIKAFFESEFQALSAEYRLAELEGKSGIELFVYMAIGDSYSYQIHIDLVLENILSGQLVVAEIKTGQKHNAADWENSDQTLGYYAFLEYLCKTYGYEMESRILYITCVAGEFLKPEDNYGFHTFVFEKGPDASVEFAQNLMTDIATIELYIDHKHFPKRGNSCMNFNRQCEFFGLCDLPEYKHPTAEVMDSDVYESLTMDDVDFTFSLSDLITEL